MVVLGHLVQVFHIVLIYVVVFISTLRPYFWVLPMLVVLAATLNPIFEGCPLTVFSNFLLRRGGARTYQDTAEWLEDMTSSRVGALSILVCGIMVVLLGMAMNYKSWE